MDTLEKQVGSYKQDQDILNARGIQMTVEEVAGLSTSKYAERVQKLQLDEDDLAFLKGLRRRIKNRLASQNSRRRNLEHVRRLTRELRAVRACVDEATTEHKALLAQRDAVRLGCRKLADFITQVLKDRKDPSQIPDIEVKSVNTVYTESPIPTPESETDIPDFNKTERDKTIFECRLEKLVQQSVNHIFKDMKKVTAKTVYLDDRLISSDVKNYIATDLNCHFKGIDGKEDVGVLNLSVKERKGHGRKQSAPRRIAYAFNDDNCVLDLKIKKESDI